MESDALSARPIAKIALPGVSKDDLKVEVHDTHLTISARRNAEAEKMKDVVYHRDRHTGSFFRSILLPDGIDVDRIQASFTDGVLEVKVLEPRKVAATRERRDGHDTSTRRSQAWRPPMVEIRTILCPVDFSDHSRYAFEHAVGLAAWYGASVSVLHVHQIAVPAPVTDPLVPPLAVPPIMVTGDGRDRASQQLLEFIAAGRAEHARIESVVEDGIDVAAAILLRAENVDADLIALGTNGQSPRTHALGATAEGVLRDARRPVLCVPSKGADGLPQGPVSFRRIICPVDFSESSARALAYAASLARDANAWLTVVHVVELVSEVAALAPDFDEHREVRLEPARRSLRELVAGTVHESIASEELLQMGTPHDEIIHLADEQKAGLLVIGLQGKRAGQTKLGATIGAVVSRSSCPVLVVP